MIAYIKFSWFVLYAFCTASGLLHRRAVLASVKDALLRNAPPAALDP
jgi:hypothetical protein